MSADTITLSVSCLCSASKYEFSLPKSSLRLQTFFCHCDTCRHSTGVLCAIYTRIPSGSPGDLTPLTAYESSDRMARYFCSTCGAHMFAKYKDEPWDVAMGVLNGSEGIVEFAGHIWTSSPGDGGLATMLPAIDDKPLKMWKEDSSGGTEVTIDALEREKNQSEVDSEKVHAHCHCGGVAFYISKPNAKSTEAKSPLPDLTAGNESVNVRKAEWWLQANGSRFLAGTCTCTSCRLNAGFDVVQWSFVPASNMSLQDGQPWKLTFGTMKCYNSSPGITRTFCGVCGAMVFFQTERRSNLLDVAVGLLDASSGARAEELLEWYTERVSHEEEAPNKVLVRGLQHGLKAWHRRRQSGNSTV